MSRLDSAIRRLSAQRACLDLAARLVQRQAGPVLEFGLGNGRTYDHLREILPGREIFVFERQVAAHPDCIPDDSHLFLGDFLTTIATAAACIGAPAALAHLDIGSGDVAATRELARRVAGEIGTLLANDAIVVADQALDHASLRAMDLPGDVARERYYMYRHRPEM